MVPVQVDPGITSFGYQPAGGLGLAGIDGGLARISPFKPGSLGRRYYIVISDIVLNIGIDKNSIGEAVGCQFLRIVDAGFGSPVYAVFV